MARMINLKSSKTQVIKQLNSMHIVDIVNELYSLEEEEKVYLIQLIPLELIDNIFIELEDDELLDFFFNLDEIKKRHLLNDLSANELKPLFELLDKEDRTKLFSSLSLEKSEKLMKLMLYDETEAASIMKDNYLTIERGLMVSDAMKTIIKDVEDTDIIDIIFVLEDNKLVGTISLKDLIIARKNDLIEDIIEFDFKFINENSMLIDAINKISNYDIQILPVVNDELNLIGIITAEDVLEEIALEHESNIDKFVAVGDFDEDSRPLRRALQRLPWLLVSIVLNLVIALFLSIFSHTIDTITALILFQPLILGMAGNIGTQAIAVTILKIHKNEEENYSLHIKKEVLIGLINAVIIGVLGFLLSYGFLSVTSFQTANVSLVLLSLVIGLSLALSMFLSAMFGVFIPLILTKFKIDPAAASGPVISTINDLVALFIYFGLATLIIIPLII